MLTSGWDDRPIWSRCWQRRCNLYQAGRWQENVIAELATSCRENRLFEQSVEYFEEVISIRQRSRRPGIGHGTLSDYYRQLSEVYAGLQRPRRGRSCASGHRQLGTAMTTSATRRRQRWSACSEQVPDLAEVSRSGPAWIEGWPRRGWITHWYANRSARC